MKLLKIIVLGVSFSFSIAAVAGQAGEKYWGKKFDRSIDSSSSQTLDEHEALHLVFMREEEKLARDVYTYFSILYPKAKIFGKIDDAEQRHADAVLEKLDKYNIPDPSTNDNIGVFTGKEYGTYFTETYMSLIEQGSTSQLDALYVGAFIEELDIHDINQCPDETLLQEDTSNADQDCGRLYTDNTDIKRLYSSLLSGSENHLRAYVRNIERVIGPGNYRAQMLPPEQLEDILGR